MTRRLVILASVAALVSGALFVTAWWVNQTRGPLEPTEASAGKDFHQRRTTSEGTASFFPWSSPPHPPEAGLAEGGELSTPTVGDSPLSSDRPSASVEEESTPAFTLPSAEVAGEPLGPVLSQPHIPTLPPKRPGQRTVVLDPGHGGEDGGATHRNANGEVDLVEQEVNRLIALRVRQLLEAEGFRVILTREGDGWAVSDEALIGVQGYRRIRADLQARVDIANAAEADLFLSIHNNGSNSPSESGTEVWYDPNRPFSEHNIALAELLQEHVVRALRTLGHPVRDRGIKNDATFRVWQGRTFPIFVLGPPRTEPAPTRATQMPGALLEALFVSNDTDAAALRRSELQEAIAQGIREAIVRYFQRVP